MGQKVHPYGFRLGVTKTWRSRWFAKQDYAKLLREDLELKESLHDRLKAAGVSSIEVDRPGNKLRITIHTSRPGIIIGRKGAEIEKLKGDLAKKTKREVFIDIQEVHKPELDAKLVSESIGLQLEKRVAFRRAMRLFTARKMLIASPALWPRIRSTTSRALCGDVRRYRASALASIKTSAARGQGPGASFQLCCHSVTPHHTNQRSLETSPARASCRPRAPSLFTLRASPSSPRPPWPRVP